MSTPTVDHSGTWVERGTGLLLDTMDRLSDEQLDEPCALPHWSRRQLLAHLASHAEAIGRLVDWARTGRENRMYASARHRETEIENGAKRADLRDWVRASAAELSCALSDMPEAAWDAPVVTAQGRTVPGAETVWLRARETCIHTTDLRTGVTFADLPEGFLTALVEEVTAWRAARPGPHVVLSTPTTTYEIAGAPPSHHVELALPDAAAWLVGRAIGPRTQLPELPGWI